MADSKSTSTAHLSWYNYITISVANMKLLHLCLTAVVQNTASILDGYVFIPITAMEPLHLWMKVVAKTLLGY